MKKYVFLLALLLCIRGLNYARDGYVVLTNGHTLCGDITIARNGDIWVKRDKSTVVFAKKEVKNIQYDNGSPQKKKKEIDPFFKALQRIPPQQTNKKNNSYDYLVYRASEKMDLEPALIKAVMYVESGYDQYGISPKGAQGLMQLMPETAKILGVKDPFNPQDNIIGGSRYLRRMLDLFEGDITLALAAYNAGPEAVRKYGSVPPYKETREYVKKVMTHYRNAQPENCFFEYMDMQGCLYLSNYWKDGRYKPIKQGFSVNP